MSLIWSEAMHITNNNERSTGEKPIKCPYCPDKFADPARRHKHVARVHSDKPTKRRRKAPFVLVSCKAIPDETWVYRGFLLLAAQSFCVMRFYVCLTQIELCTTIDPMGIYTFIFFGFFLAHWQSFRNFSGLRCYNDYYILHILWINLRYPTKNNVKE